MAKLKYDFLSNYYQRHRRPVRDYLFGYINTVGKVARPFAPAINWALQSQPGKYLGEHLSGLSAKRGLPPFKWGNKLFSRYADNGGDVLFLRDPFAENFYPELTRAALKVLTAAGFKPRILPIVGAGRTLISKGFLPQARNHARRVLRAIEKLDPDGRLRIVGIEPSEIYTLRDEYLDLLPAQSDLRRLARRAYMLDEFLLRSPDFGNRPIESLSNRMNAKAGSRVLLHAHCYQKTQPPADDGMPSGQQATAELLSALGYEVEIINSGCCGMAGSFGYEAEHYELSMQIGELALFPAVRAAAPDQQIVASGVSCRTQITSGTGREALHPISLIAANLVNV
jgi:Fe-S oxidoreductase